MMSPIFSQLSDEMAGKVKFVKVDSDENGDICERFNVMGLPTLMLFHKGKVIAAQAGAMRKEGLQDFITKSLAAKGISM